MRKFRTILTAFFVMATMVSCGSDTPEEPNDNGGNNNNGQVTPNNPDNNENEEVEYTVDSHGYATYTHEGFTFKIKLNETKTTEGKKAIEYIKEDRSEDQKLKRRENHETS